MRWTRWGGKSVCKRPQSLNLKPHRFTLSVHLSSRDTTLELCPGPPYHLPEAQPTLWRDREEIEWIVERCRLCTRLCRLLSKLRQPTILGCCVTVCGRLYGSGLSRVTRIFHYRMQDSETRHCLRMPFHIWERLHQKF